MGLPLPHVTPTLPAPSLAARPAAPLDCGVLLLVASQLCYAFGALVERTLAPGQTPDWVPAALFRRLAVGLLTAVWAGVLLAQLGRFDLVTVLLLLVGATVLLAVRLLLARRAALYEHRRALWRPGRWGRPSELVALAALLTLAGFLFAHPGEDVLGARDPGIYFASGVAIARQGAILQDDEALRLLADDLGDASINYWLFQSVHGWPLRFPGQLFVRDLDLGQVEPGFLPWYPVSIALAVDAAGLPAGLWANPVLATLALFAVYLTGRTLFGRWVAWLGAALLAINLAQVWFARYTLAEPATQFLLWTGLYGLAATQRRPDLAFAALTGLAWGSLFLVRVEAVLLAPPVAGYLVWQARRPTHRPCALFALALVALGAAHFAVHAWRFAPGYTTMVFSGATLAIAAGGIALSLTLGAAVWLLLPPSRSIHRPASTGPARGGMPRAPWIGLVVLLGVATLFAYAARPALPLPAPAGEAGELETAARESLVRLGWYVTPLGLALALAGGAAALWRPHWQRAAPLLGLLAFALAFYLPNPLVSSDQPWAARRYLPLVLPGLLLLAAVGAVVIGRAVRRRTRLPHHAGTVAAATLVLAIAAGEYHATAPLVAYREHGGALAQIEALAALVPPDAVILFPRSAAGLRLTLPLHYLGERRAFVLPAEGPVEGILQVVRRWRLADYPVYWVVPAGTRFPTPAGVRFLPAGQFTFAVPQLERPLDRLPRTSEPLRFDLQLYRIELEP